jgi:tRNA (guanine26-N2/guanine27-N2)-dimethyltransferase
MARILADQGPLRVLDGMAGCGIRALRYGLEARASAVWANDADPNRLPLLEANLKSLAAATVRTTALTAQSLLAGCLQRQERFELVDLDAFGCPTSLVPLALEAVSFGGVLYLASTDGRSPTGHDRTAAIRHWGAAARTHPASWELALRLQLGAVARSAWAMGRGIEPLFSFSEGRTFRTAVRVVRLCVRKDEEQLGLVALCHQCGDQQVQSLLRLRQWQACSCAAGERAPLAISGPLWIGPLQQSHFLEQMAALAREPGEILPGVSQPGVGRPAVSPAALKLLVGLVADPGVPARCWPTADLARRLKQGPPRLDLLVEALRSRGAQAWPSGVMAGQFRSDAPWPLILQTAQELAARAIAAAK